MRVQKYAMARSLMGSYSSGALIEGNGWSFIWYIPTLCYSILSFFLCSSTPTT